MSKPKSIPIFYYHSIGADYGGSQTLSLEVFNAHLTRLKENAFHTITLSNLLKNNYDPNVNNAVLTFDDGLLDNYENAFPLLSDFGFVGTFFVVPGFDNLTRWVHPRKGKWSNCEKEGYIVPFKNMQSQHRLELVTAGMEIGSHSFTHPKLNRIPKKALFYEIVDSKKKLEDELGVVVETFCYPNGKYNSEVLDAVEEAGYAGATTTIPGYFNPKKSVFKINRFLIENSLFFSEVLQGNGLSPYAYLKTKFQSCFEQEA